MSNLAPQENFCTNCGDWFSDAEYNHEAGWCNECVGPPPQSLCSQCNQEMPASYKRTICNKCVEGNWLTLHADEIEYLVVCKGYSISRARIVLAELIRPVCQICKEPIPHGTPGESLTCGRHKRFRRKLVELARQGLSPREVLTEIERMHSIQ